MRIEDWPAGERPREKLLARGAAALSEIELLAIWLQRGHGGAGALELARRLLVEFGSLRALLTAGCARLGRERGVGPARYAELQAALELARRHQLELLRAGPTLASPRLAGDYLLAQLRDRDHEVFCCLFMDNRHRLIAYEELFHGTIDGATVHPREVVKRALERRAAAVILAHNHPLCCIAVSPPPRRGTCPDMQPALDGSPAR
jgi:DNA repair protein RadC